MQKLKEGVLDWKQNKTNREHFRSTMLINSGTRQKPPIRMHEQHVCNRSAQGKKCKNLLLNLKQIDELLLKFLINLLYSY